MSGVVKKVGKVFKKMKLGKILPIALGAGALIFTAGAMLGVPAMAGGWGGAVGKVTSTLGLSGSSANIIGGAATMAGYGSLTGGVLGKVTGGSFTEGMKKGAMFGGAGGAAMGAIGAWQAPASSVAATSAPATSSGLPATQAATGPMPTGRVGLVGGTDPFDHSALVGRGMSSQMSGAVGPGAAPGALPGSPGMAMAARGAAMPVAAPQGAMMAGTAAQGIGSWAERNPLVAATGIQALGAGLSGMAQAKAAKGDSAIERDRLQAERVAANYGTGGGDWGYMTAQPNVKVQRYTYDPAVGKIVYG